LHGQVAHDIGRRIVSGAIAEGEFLPREAELSEQFSVSRQAIREGLKVLAAKGLVTSRRRAGTFVTPRRSWNLLDPDVLAWHPTSGLPPDFLGDLVEMRRLIEPAAAEFAARRGNPQTVTRIGAAVDAMTKAVGDSEAFYLADVEFHLAVFAASGNQLIDRLSTILGPLLEASLAQQVQLGGSREAGVAMHRAIYDAILAGDPAKAHRGMEKVLALASDEITQLMRARAKKTA
jgi:GntR family galactonate operon transcriptional repressor